MFINFLKYFFFNSHSYFKLSLRLQIQPENNNKILLFSDLSDWINWSTNFESEKNRKNIFWPNYISYGVITCANITNSNHCYKSRALFKRSSTSSVMVWSNSQVWIYQPKIQKTKMLVTCQRFGDLFLFGMVWQYSTNQNQYNKGMFKVMATYLQQ